MKTETTSKEPASTPPKARQLVTLLGPSHAAYRNLTGRFGHAICEWRQYKKTTPWVLKVHHADRTLCYIQPEEGQFAVTVLLGPRATEAALAGRVTKKLHAAINAARPYAEGRPVRVMVKSEADLEGVAQLIDVKLDPAGKPTRPSRPSRGRKQA